MSELVIKGRAKVAEIVGVTVNGLIKMEQRGLPIAKKRTGATDANEYHLPAVFQWLKNDQARQILTSQSAESVTDLARRRAKAEARRAEIEVAKLEASVVEVMLVRRGLESVILNQRTNLLGLPAQIGREIDEPDVRVRVVSIADRKVREVLQVLAAYDPVIDPGDASGAGDDGDPVDHPADAPAAETHDQPVGRTKKVSEPRRRSVGKVAKRHRAVPHGDHGRSL